MATRKDDSDKYPDGKPLDTIVEVVMAFAEPTTTDAETLASFIQTAHSRRMEDLHQRVVDGLSGLEQQPPARSLAQRARDGDEDAREEILSTYAMIARLVQEAMDEEKRRALASAMVFRSLLGRGR